MRHAALVAGVLVSLACGDEADVPRTMPGDVAQSVAAMDTAEMVARARTFLDTDRPWRAARVLREYRERADGLTPEQRILAARAEGGWGAWPEARALLEDAPGIERIDGGVGLYLLGRARDAEGDAPGAVQAYRAFLALPQTAELAEQHAAARFRLGLAQLRAGERAEARATLAAARREAGEAEVWLDLIEADALAETGDTAAVRAAVAEYDDGLLGLRAWRARVKAALNAKDTASARALASQARRWAKTDGTQAEFLVAAARAAKAMGDSAAASDALRGAIERDGAGPYGREAAALLREGRMTPADHLAVARVLDAQGLHEDALDGFRAWLDAGAGSAAERQAVLLELGEALFYAGRFDEVADALSPVAKTRDARFLRARAASQANDAAEAVEIYSALAAENAGNGIGAHALFLAADAWHEDNEPDKARALYRQVVARYPGRDQMGLSLLRLAGIAYNEKEYAEAARLWDQYRSRYPRGERVLQATYWSARARAEAGDSVAAAALYRSIREKERDGYYALLASRHLGEPFWPIPLSRSPAPAEGAAQTVARWMRGVDLLREAGYPEEASAEADRLLSRTGGDRAVRYALAEALAERGYARRAILLGHGLSGGDPSERLLRILYPFPYRQLIVEEARDRGMDPMIAAAMIRQESMYEARITSPAGARGLMQIMPATGAELAEAVGIDRWDPELLYHPEINVHLGVRYLAQLLEDYNGSLPAAFGAYNAGPHRVERWSRFPEFGQDELFTERIPFRETRDYVRTLTLNREFYGGLHGK